MEPRKISVTLAYQKEGTNPPIYVAGSFTDPQWQPLEMMASHARDGEYLFTKSIMVDEGTEIYYKFRIGPGDWWALDPKAETSTDARGNINSILRIPTSESRSGISQTRESHADELAEVDPRSKSQVPKIAGAPAKVADSKKPVEPSAPELDILDEDEDVDSLMPVFSYECPNDENICQPSSPTASSSCHPQYDTRPQQEHDEGTDLDVDDPLIEHFPSDRESIFAAMRRLSTSVEPDRTVVEGAPLSPVVNKLAHLNVGVGPTQASTKSSDEHQSRAVISQGSASPVHAMGTVASRGSLQSIEEDDEFSNQDFSVAQPQSSSPVQRSGHVPKSYLAKESNASDMDEGIAMSDVPRKTSTASSEPISPKTVPRRPAARGPRVLEHTSGTAPQDGASEEAESLPIEISHQTSLQKRTETNRSDTPSSNRSVQGINQSSNWLPGFFRTLFIDWVGGFLGWLFGRRNGTLR
ncbi:hypothetical protein F5Y15DRAFT_422959 [Xylariaceae sp. FL0016]|nr:hypothetical protein F5Y15DRAFT_422959 [Xylariaceae sp. FL0016]